MPTLLHVFGDINRNWEMILKGNVLKQTNSGKYRAYSTKLT